MLKYIWMFYDRYLLSLNRWVSQLYSKSASCFVIQSVSLPLTLLLRLTTWGILEYCDYYAIATEPCLIIVKLFTNVCTIPERGGREKKRRGEKLNSKISKKSIDISNLMWIKVYHKTFYCLDRKKWSKVDYLSVLHQAG